MVFWVATSPMCVVTDGEGGEHGLRVRPAGDVQGVRAAEVLAQPQPLAEEERGEQAALGGLGDAAERFEVRLRSGFGRLPDGSGVDALEEDAELQLAGRLKAGCRCVLWSWFSP